MKPQDSQIQRMVSVSVVMVGSVPIATVGQRYGPSAADHPRGAQRGPTHDPAPGGAIARCDGQECVGERWDSPRALLADYEREALELAFPTLRHLEQLSTFASAGALLEHARTHEVRPVLPRVVRGGEIARLVLP